MRNKTCCSTNIFFYFSLPSWIPNGLFILHLPIHTIYIYIFYYSQCKDVNFMIFHPYRHSRLLFFSNIHFYMPLPPSYAILIINCTVCTHKVGIYCVILLKNSNLIWLCCRSLLHQKFVFLLSLDLLHTWMYFLHSLSGLENLMWNWVRVEKYLQTYLIDSKKSYLLWDGIGGRLGILVPILGGFMNWFEQNYINS